MVDLLKPKVSKKSYVSLNFFKMYPYLNTGPLFSFLHHYNFILFNNSYCIFESCQLFTHFIKCGITFFICFCFCFFVVVFFSAIYADRFQILFCLLRILFICSWVSNLSPKNIQGLFQALIDATHARNANFEFLLVFDCSKNLKSTCSLGEFHL